MNLKKKIKAKSKETRKKRFIKVNKVLIAISVLIIEDS